MLDLHHYDTSSYLWDPILMRFSALLEITSSQQVAFLQTVNIVSLISITVNQICTKQNAYLSEDHKLGSFIMAATLAPGN